MAAPYLRIKKWKDWQHYKDREPPWVKMHAKLLQDSAFMELGELEQWQLARIWLIASWSSRFTRDEHGRLVPVVAYDERTIRRAIASLKRVPLAKFVAQGWLIEVAEEDLVDKDDDGETAKTARVSDQKTDVNSGGNGSENPVGITAAESLNQAETETSDASPVLSPDLHGASALLEVEVERFRELPTTQLNGRTRPQRTSLPVNDHLLDKLVTLCGSSADNGTRTVFANYACRLPDASLARVIETTAAKPVEQRARYANGALKSELEERVA